MFVLSEIFEDPSSISERLISNKSLDDEAAAIESQMKAEAASEGKGGGH